MNLLDQIKYELEEDEFHAEIIECYNKVMDYCKNTECDKCIIFETTSHCINY